MRNKLVLQDKINTRITRLDLIRRFSTKSLQESPQERGLTITNKRYFKIENFHNEHKGFFTRASSRENTRASKREHKSFQER